MIVRLSPALLLAAAACTPPALDGESAEEVGVYLDGHEGFRERTRPRQGALGHFAGSPRFGGEGLGFPRPFTVAELGEELVVVHTDREIELAIWIERDELTRTVPEPSWTHHTREGDVGVQLPAGIELEIVDERDEQVRVRAESSLLQVDTWVDRADLEPYWIEADPVAPDVPNLNDALAGHTVLLDAPNGEPVAALLPLNEDVDEPYFPVERVEQVGDWVRVRGYQDWPFDAWVAKEAVHATTRGFGSFRTHCGCGGSYASGGSAINVAAGTPLYAGIDAQPVGRTVVDAYWDLQEEPEGWLSAQHWTPLGTATLFIAPEDRL